VAATAPSSGTLREWIGYVERRFAHAGLVFGHGTHNARDEAVWLLVHVLGIDFDSVDSESGTKLSPAEGRKTLQILAERIRSRKPLAYLLKEAWLMGERFYVDERVIVPRSFIAELWPAGLKPWVQARKPPRILDLCTGSGCLAILAAKAFPRARVDASDISRDALAVARRNVREHRLRSRITLEQGDLFEGLAPARYDLIVSNPPYVDSGSMRRLPQEYRREPKLALAGGKDGLDLALRILERAPEFLAARGVLVMEIGHNRRALEKRLPRLPLTWMSTSAGDDMVLLAQREQLRNRELAHSNHSRQQSR
jgi:ribosomal protein L3 glutamine methyltransferase